VVGHNGETRVLAGPVAFNVKRLRTGALPSASLDEIERFNTELDDLYGQTTAVRYTIRDSRQQLDRLTTMLARMSRPPGVRQQSYSCDTRRTV
jgi:HPt (histidine-containing phosphotransfer) domain-containing protein